MTTSDKKPRRPTKSAKAAKAVGNADTPERPSIRATAGPEHPFDGAAPGLAAGSGPDLSATVALAKPARARSAGAEKKATETQRIKDVSVTVTSRHREDRHASIALAAYFRSESRGFAPGHEVEDWLAAEEEVDQRLLGEGRVS